MRLSLYTDYTFRLLIHLAVRDPRTVSIAEVADAYAISRNHLTKIAHALGRSGYLRTMRGRGGGLRLALPADRIKAGEIARMAETGSVLVECFDRERNRCVITPACTLKHALAAAERAFFAVLDNYTIADFAGDKPALSSLLADHQHA